jgi:hypothetical protein
MSDLTGEGSRTLWWTVLNDFSSYARGTRLRTPLGWFSTVRAIWSGHMTATGLLQTLASVGESSKGWNRSGNAPMGVGWCQQARHAVGLARVELRWRGDDRREELGFASVFDKILAWGSPIYRGFRYLTCTTRILTLFYLQFEFQTDFPTWFLYDSIEGESPGL